MKKLWPLLLMVIPLQLIHAQEVHHAPTVEQCRADQKLWLSRVENPADVANVSYDELIGWNRELLECSEVDLAFKLPYFNTLSEIKARLLSRFIHFLGRHNLYDQFLAEDAQGKR